MGDGRMPMPFHDLYLDSSQEVPEIPIREVLSRLVSLIEGPLARSITDDISDLDVSITNPMDAALINLMTGSHEMLRLWDWMHP